MFGIIIPTYNRKDVLKETLEGYIRQSATYLIKDIVVIDDGSDENNRYDNEYIVRDAAARATFPIIYIYQDNSGPSRARNIGISRSNGDILLITGDDIVPDKNMVMQHFLIHKNYNFAENVCVLGRNSWPDSFFTTPFMEYINEMGLQFGYSIISDPEDVPFSFFYTSNISVHRNFLMGDNLFDTDFPYAAWEDIELSYRLKKRGMRIVYNKKAIGYHHHYISFDSCRKRQEKCGYAAYIFYKKHPELKKFLSVTDSYRESIPLKLEIAMMEKICLVLEKYRINVKLSYFYVNVMDYYYKIGMKRYLATVKEEGFAG